MKNESPSLFIVLGPPASGKLTTAKALAAAATCKVFSNHHTADFVAQFIPIDSTAFSPIVDKLRIEIIDAMLAEGQSIAFTFAYSGSPGDAYFLHRLRAVASRRHVSTTIARLRCSTEELIRRVRAADRKAFRKLHDPRLLKNALSRHNYNAELDLTPSIWIDSEQLSPERAAKLILDEHRRRASSDG